jgi:hypothetical protein
VLLVRVDFLSLFNQITDSIYILMKTKFYFILAVTLKEVTGEYYCYNLYVYTLLSNLIIIDGK